MACPPLELSLTLNPRTRYDAIDVASHIVRNFGDVLHDYHKVLYCSHHTTAGFLDQRLAARLEHRRERVDPFIGAFQRLFPQNAGYNHDQMHLRKELSEAQRELEPPNADAHLTYIGSGLRNCVTYHHCPGSPVFFMDLDGVYQGRARTRTASVVAYNQEEFAAERIIEIPVPRHAVASVNLADESVGLGEQVREMLGILPEGAGRVDVVLDPSERCSALTVNEFETLLMRHDLTDVMENPLRFAAHQGLRMLRDPRAVPAKSLGYAKYDFVRLLNQLIDSLGLGESTVELILNRAMAYPASRLLRWKRSISMAVSCRGENGPQLLRGTYQSPILIQWKAAPGRVRRLRLRLTRLV